jgi:hypothetical protein
VILSYKNLMNVEQAFREIKNFLDVGPLRHWNAKRVSGLIFVCVLATCLSRSCRSCTGGIGSSNGMKQKHWPILISNKRL